MSNLSDIGAIYAALRTTLTSGAPSWANRAYADQVPASTTSTPIVRPYVTYGFTGGGDNNSILKADPNHIIDVLCIADTLEAALGGASEIRDRLDDQGEQDIQHTIGGNSSWSLKTITHEGRIHFVERVNNGATQIYHSGGRYRFQLEKK